MAAGDLITQDVEVELRGLLMGPGTPYELRGAIDGLGDLEQRGNNLARPLDHGVFAGRLFYGERTIRIPLNIDTTTQADAIDALAELGTAWRLPDEDLDGSSLTTELVFRLGGRRYHAIGQPRRVAYNVDQLPRSGYVSAVAEFTATDPRLYGDAQALAVPPASITGGLSFPHGFPHGFGSASAGAVAATNDGNFPTYPVVTFTAGPSGLGQPRIIKTATGEELALSTELVNGDVLVVDFAERTAYLNGTGSRAGDVIRPGSTWWQLDPGPNALQFAAGGALDGTASVAWHDAYLFG